MEARSDIDFTSSVLEPQKALELQEAVSKLRDNDAFQAILAIVAYGREKAIKRMLDEDLTHTEYAKLTGFVAGLEQFGSRADAIDAYAEREARKIDREQESEELVELAPDGLTPAT